MNTLLSIYLRMQDSYVEPGSQLSYEYFIVNLFANAGFIRGAGPARQHLLTPDVR